MPVLVACSLTGCQNGAHALPPRAAVTPVVRPVVTREQAARVLDGYSQAATRAREPAAGVLAEVVRSARPPSSPVTLANAVLYVPRSVAYPKWFAASALERRDGAERPVLLLFTQAGARAEWLPADRLYLTGAPPKIATDAQGYAVMVAPRASGPALRPADVPAVQARYLDHGDQRAIAPGGAVSRWRAGELRREQALRARGVSVTGRFAPTGHPVYALRAQGGGAFVWSALRRTVTYTAGGPADLPTDVRSALGARAGRTVDATWLWRTVTYVPARGRAGLVTRNVDLVAARAY